MIGSVGGEEELEKKKKSPSSFHVVQTFLPHLHLRHTWINPFQRDNTLLTFPIQWNQPPSILLFPLCFARHCGYQKDSGKGYCVCVCVGGQRLFFFI